METFAIAGMHEASLDLETFLGGMETAMESALLLRSSASLETFLGGMETRKTVMPQGWTSALKPSLVEWKRIQKY